MTTVPRICDLEDCGTKLFARGLCKSHYEKARYAKALPPRETIAQGKICMAPGCSLNTHAWNLCQTHYLRVKNGSRDPHGVIRTYDSSRGCDMPECERKYSTMGLCAPHYHRTRAYNISRDQLIDLESHNCQICDSPPPASGRSHHIDHDHSCCPESAKSCGECVRGVLCSNCNTAIGSLKEDPELFRRAIEYLSRPSDKLI